MESYDVAVIGLGGMGSAALAHVARRGARAIGIEQFARGHALGASSGRSRLFRTAYYEHRNYVPLLLRAYDAWREVERDTGVSILRETGLLMTGPPESPVIAGAARSARAYGLPVEHLDAVQIAARFPMMRPLPGEVGVFEPGAGFVIPEAAVDAHLRIAERHGAQMRFESAVMSWERTGSLLRVRLADGGEVEAARAIVCAGPWWAVHGEAVVPVRLQRNVQLWFRPLSDAFTIGRCPAFLIERSGFPEPLYGFPDYGCGVKAAFHGNDVIVSPERLDREIHAADVEPLRAALDAWMPGAAADVIEGKACMYAMTPDEHFVVGTHPTEPSVIVAGGFSGHGFKFVAVMGEVLADLALDGGTRYDIAFLSPTRFARA